MHYCIHKYLWYNISKKSPFHLSPSTPKVILTAAEVMATLTAAATALRAKVTVTPTAPRPAVKPTVKPLSANVNWPNPSLPTVPSAPMDSANPKSTKSLT